MDTLDNLNPRSGREKVRHSMHRNSPTQTDMGPPFPLLEW